MLKLYIVLITFAMLQFAFILLFVRSLRNNKKMQGVLRENKIRHQELVYTTKQLTELNKLKDKLFTTLIHDIRNPMATMVSMMEMLEENYYSSESREIVHEVRKQVKKTFFMMENLLEYLNSQKDELVYKDISKILQETKSLILD